MDTDAKGQLGGIECAKDARERMARDSAKWQCPSCAKTNAEIIKEREDAVRDLEGEPHQDEKLPDELRLAYRDELGSQSEAADKPAGDKPADDKVTDKAVVAEASTSAPRPAPRTQPPPSSRVAVAAPRPTRTVQPVPLPEQYDPVMLLINIAIGSIVALLLYMSLRKL
jgi:ubiquitin-conjugating enzyme E2 J1